MLSFTLRICNLILVNNEAIYIRIYHSSTIPAYFFSLLQVYVVSIICITQNGIKRVLYYYYLVKQSGVCADWRDECMTNMYKLFSNVAHPITNWSRHLYARDL